MQNRHFYSKRRTIIMLDGSITKRKDGRIELQITIGIDSNGKRIRKSFYGKSEREVKTKKNEWLQQYSLARGDTNSSMSFSAWADKWLIVYKQNTVRPYTYENTYRTRVEKYLKLYFKQRPMDAITPLDIQALPILHFQSSMYSISISGNTSQSGSYAIFDLLLLS